jgi:hypothetical protein
VTFGAELLPSTIIELVGIPALTLWVAKANRTTNGVTAADPRVAVAA